MTEQHFEIPPEVLEIPDLPESLKETDSYHTDVAFVSAVPPTQIEDKITKDGVRNRRWGFLLCAQIIPNLDKVAYGPLVFPPPRLQFIDAEDLELLRERVIHEIDVAIEVAKKLKAFDAKLIREAEVKEMASQIAGQYGAKISDNHPESSDDKHAATITE